MFGSEYLGTLMSASEERWRIPESSEFLEWVEGNPTHGLVALFLGMAVITIFMIPIGTPLTLGCGYIYKGAYGWRLGLTVATSVSVGGCALGSVVCFWLGRYLMRDQVRTWIRKYPLFDAIDIAAGEHGFRIMAMLYLTPILPLGPVSYMCGTTSMSMSSFFFSKITSLPPMLLYCFIGASTDALIGNDDEETEGVTPIHKNQVFILSGIALSLVMLTCITQSIKRELNRILERQKKSKPDQLLLDDELAIMEGCESSMDFGLTKRRV